MTTTSNSTPMTQPVGAPRADPPTSEAVAAFGQSVLAKLTYMVGKDPAHAQEHDWLLATALAVRDRIVDRWMDATRRTYRDGRKRVYYFSLEFLIGRLLFDALGNLGLTDTARAALRELGVDLDRLRRLEPDAALGNGGLGRLAACFMESMATLGIPAHRLRHPLRPRHLPAGAEGRLAARASRGLAVLRQPVGVRAPGGQLPRSASAAASRRSRRDGETTRYAWEPAERVNAVAFDTPLVGWRGRHVNTLRLWSARRPTRCGSRTSIAATTSARWPTACALEAISRVLYPSDETAAGHELRLRQEYFFASASLQDLLRRHHAQHGDFSSLADHVSIQLNDTHPAIAVAELMRLLVDVHEHAVGARVGRHDVRLQLHQPHAAARGAGNLAGLADGKPAPAAHADHLPDQRAAPRSPARRGSRPTTRSWPRSR